MTEPDHRVSFWIHEHISPWDVYAHGVTRVLDYRRTEFQEMYIVETGSYGKALVLDGKWQSCTGDEFLYHEPLVHPAMLHHGSPKKVLILGGGEGATAREVLRWKSVENVTMVDIDGEVVEACKKHLPEMHQGVFDDSRFSLRIDDALHVLDSSSATWDVIVSDLSDPIEDGPSFKLFTKEYFEQARRALAEGGVFVVQAGPVSPYEMKMHARIVRTMGTVFGHVRSYTTHVPTYASPWGFALGSSKPIPSRPEPDEIDALLALHTTGGFLMFDGETLLGMMQLPIHLRRAIQDEKMVYTLDQPPKFFGKGNVKVS